MKPVDQTEFEAGRGNCIAACLASILELPVTDVPNFTLSDDKWAAVTDWLASNHHILPLITPWPLVSPFSRRHCVLLGASPRSERGHAVVGLLDGYKAEVIHDPHPTRAGIVGDPQFVLTFLPNTQELC